MRRLGSALCITILIGCSRMSAASSLPATSEPTTSASGFKTLYQFKSEKNGVIPVGALIEVSGTLYGATNFGGNPSKECFPNAGCGTVYDMSTSGTFSNLYRFNGRTSGARPYAGLIDVGGTLYGTAQEGGAHKKGTVFALSTSGTETVLHAFGGKDGNDPRTSLTSANGTLYGTTYYGGSAGAGTVFSVTSAGAEKVLHSFAGGSYDGSLPLGSLIYVNKMLYGTTSSGGTNGEGTVFEVSPSGSNYTVLHSFQGSADGAYPFAGLTESNGVLYGTTQQGGAHNLGTVFAITTASGSESVIHSFGSGKDGSKPLAGLTVLNGQLYGTTSFGGSNNLGSIYTISPSGSESVVHSFPGGAGGQFPDASLTAVGSVLYGTTMWSVGKKDGIAFEFTP
jgi:uncharacterized repeat protein (TIGR03803 family)